MKTGGHRVVRIMDGAPRTWVLRLPLMVLAVLAAGFLALGVAEARADAPTFDEPVYVSPAWPPCCITM